MSLLVLGEHRADLKKYGYRQADGSYNNVLYPSLGAAKMPYARTVKPAAAMAGVLPDPGVIFDSILKRKHYDNHPNGISSMLFYFASVIIHDLFRTDHRDFTISNTTSYLDLSPLYGSDQEEQDSMRTFKGGKIKPDSFSETRLLFFPPGVTCLLIMFNRWHNHVVEQLALINENSQFAKPAKGASEWDKYVEEQFAIIHDKSQGQRTFQSPDRDSSDSAWAKYDNDLFQTGRLITCGLYIHCILHDYVRTILNLNQTDSNWQLDPRVKIKNGPPLGSGNQVAAEFNLVYRWHETISARDEQWTRDKYRTIFGKEPEEVQMPEFLQKLKKLTDDIPVDPTNREYAGFDGRTARDQDGKLPDDHLVAMLKAGIEDCANAFGANRVPSVLKAVEVLGIIQARKWNVASLNEFRKHFGLNPHRTFLDINSDPEVAEQLKRLYDNPDLVELYPGLIAEEAKPATVPGSGLAANYTISRAVLSDAIALVRGDRFYTIDYHPRKLTNWGFKEAGSDVAIDNGCVFYKLFLRAFPTHFKHDSVYVHYPLTTPSKTKEVLTRLGRAEKYSWNPPAPIKQPQMVVTYSAARRIMNDKDMFNVTWGPAMEFLMGPETRDFMLAGDGPKNAESRRMMHNALYVDKWEQQVREFYENITTKLLREKKYVLAGVNTVDIIREVGNVAHVHFASEVFSLPLKTVENPRGIFTEEELYMVMAAVFATVFIDLDPVHSFHLRQKGLEVTKQLGSLVEANVTAVKNSSVFNGLSRWVYPQTTSLLQDYGVHMIQRLLGSGISVKNLVWGHILGTAGGMVANQGQLLGQTLEYFLCTHEGKQHWPAIQKLAKRDDEAAFDRLMHYMLEGSRIYGETLVMRRATEDVTIQDGKRNISLKKGDTILVNLKQASQSEGGFPDPEFNLNRNVDDYIHLGIGPHRCLGLPMVRNSLTMMLKVFGKLEGLEPAKGGQGKVAKVGGAPGGYYRYVAQALEESKEKTLRRAGISRKTGACTFLIQPVSPFTAPCDRRLLTWLAALKVNWVSDSL